MPPSKSPTVEHVKMLGNVLCIKSSAPTMGPQKTHVHVIMQNIFSLSVRVIKVLTVSQGKLLVVSPCKSRKEYLILPIFSGTE